MEDLNKKKETKKTKNSNKKVELGSTTNKKKQVAKKDSSKNKETKQPTKRKTNGSKEKLKEVISKKIELEEVVIEEDDEIDLRKLETEIVRDVKVKRKVNKKKSLIALFILLVLLILVFIGIHLVTPSISLNGSNKIEIADYDKYEELGAKAKFLNKDISDKIKISGKVKDGKIGTYTITYTVKISIFKVSIQRIVDVVDKTPPVITLKGNSTMYITPTETYKEPGYMVEDNYSKNLEDKVVITGQVKNGTLGTYILKYEVEDDNHNSYSIERKIIVSVRTDPNSGISKPGVIYLTFDDGPSSITTPVILDILKEEKVKATFFVTNSSSDSIIKRMYDEGHTVGLHTASHNYANVYSSVDNYFNDLKIVSDRVKRITGQESKIIRFPGGSSNTISRRYSSGIMSTLTEEVLNRGYRYYDWNVDSNDAYNAKTSSAVYNNVTSRLSKNRANVVLMHDIKTTTRDAIRDIIRYGKNNGYTFERIDMDTKMVRQKVNN